LVWIIFKGYITPAQLREIAGDSLETYTAIDKEAVEAKLAEGNVQLIDVRGVAEYKKGHIEGALNLFVGKLPQNLDKVSKDKPVIIHCQSGGRSAIAYSILKSNGFDNIQNYAGGWVDWSAKESELVNG
jgi:hydroxyacylglutathione hydrolase